MQPLNRWAVVGNFRSPTSRQAPILTRTARWLTFTFLILSSTQVAGSQANGVRDRLRGEFQAICDESKLRSNPFYSDRQLQQFERQIKGTFGDPLSEAETRGRLAFEYVRTGRFTEALAQISTALKVLDTHELRVPGMWGFLKELEGTAHFQAAEDQNCLQLHNHASCLLPLRQEAVHQEPASARAASAAYRELLARNPNRISARWLLNLATLLAGNDPSQLPPDFRLPRDAFAGGSSTLDPWINVGPRLLDSAPDLAGGAITDDFDGDGILDLVSTSMDPCAPMVALRGKRLESGRLGFQNVTKSWQLDVQLGGLNVIHADFDNDGHLDLLVLRGAWFGKEGRVRNSLLRNAIHEGKGFEDITVPAGLAYPAFPTQSAAVADIDGDGDLDLAVANEAADVVIDPSQASNAVNNGHPLQLFVNQTSDQRIDGDGAPPPLRFIDRTRESGLIDHSFTKSVSWGDIDNDGDPDLYLSNFGPNRLFRNDSVGGRLRFTDVSRQAGVDGRDRRTFASWFFDYDQDSDEDLFVASYNVPADVVSANLLGLELSAEAWANRPDRLRSHPMLFRNDGPDDQQIPQFTDMSQEMGFDRPILAMGANHGDLDNDGFPDVYLGTGMPDLSAIQPNVTLLNNAGQGFLDVTFDLGMAHLQKGHGVAFGDIDHDGDIDLFHQLGGAFPYDTFPNALFVNPLNSSSAIDRNWMVLQLEGTTDNSFGVGARIAVVIETRDGLRTVYATVGSGGSFGGSTFRRHIGLGKATKIRQLTVTWPSGVVETVTNIEINRYYSLLQGSGELRLISPPSLKGL